MKNLKLCYHLTITILFVYIFIQFLTLKKSNHIYRFYTDYIMNKYCIIIYLSLLLVIKNYDTYTTVLLFILIIGPFRCSSKEYFEISTTKPNITNPSTTIPSATNLNNTQLEINKLVSDNLLGTDDRFKMDDIKKDEILKEIKAQINFDPYKTDLSKDVIYEIYNKYFNNDIFTKLKSIDDDSKEYIASGNFNYIPKEKKVDYDITTYDNLLKNTAFGINSQIDSDKSSLN
jgi:hypothetical protein